MYNFFIAQLFLVHNAAPEDGPRVLLDFRPLDRLRKSLKSKLEVRGRSGGKGLSIRAMIFSLLILLPAAHGNAAPLPPPSAHAGYHFSEMLFSTAADFGNHICAMSSAVVAEIGFYDDATVLNEWHPTTWVRCTQPGSSPPFIFSGGNAGWGFACPGQSSVQSQRYLCSPQEKKPQRECNCGNPIDIAANAKVQRETDISSPNGTTFTRFYSSKIPGKGYQPIGEWRHSYERRLSSVRANTVILSAYVENKYPWGWPEKVAPDSVHFELADGTVVPFLGNASENTWQTDSAINYRLRTSLDASGKITKWFLTTPDDTIEAYDDAGKLVSITKRSGRIETLTYSDAQTDASLAPRAGLLLAVEDNYSNAIRFRYDVNGNLISVADPTGAVYMYGYDTSNALVSVTYPDGLQRQYLYNEAAYQPNRGTLSLKHYLTGIVDEISSGEFMRYATFTYNEYAQPYSTEHYGGVDKYTVAGTRVYGPLGSRTEYIFSSIDGVNYLSWIMRNEPDGRTLISHFAYDADGNMIESNDFLNVKTTYAYDNRNLEVKRVEAAETPQARTYSTSWHNLLRLPVSVTEPLRRTTYSYDAMGNELTRTIHATDDATGAQGELAGNVGAGRTWTSTYDANGKLTSRTGPRAGGVDRTIYAYDAVGNLVSVRNALGQTTRYSNHDLNGRVGRIESPNGIVTSLDYTARGWLQHQTVVAGGISQTTTYTYDGVGQLTRVDMPDGASIRYTYDGARRLVGVADALGNKIDYTLDAAGNRLSEKTSGPSGTLTLLATRQFDVLGRLQQQTGAAQ